MTLNAGDRVLAEELAPISTSTSAWTPYTPTWTASAGSPSLGNGTLSGRYKKNGRTVHLALTLTGGSTTTYGTAGAYWIFSLPASHTAAFTASGAVNAVDTGVLDYTGFCKIVSGATTLELFKSTSGRWVNNSPWTFGNTDVLNASITYETTS